MNRTDTPRPDSRSVFQPCFSCSGVATFCLLWVLLLIQFFSSNLLGAMSNLFVPDGITLATSFHEYWRGALSLEQVQGGWALHYIYWPVNIVGPIAFSVVNIGLLAIAARFFPLGIRPVLILFLFPYFLLALALPSKDISVLALSSLLVLAAVHDRLLLMLLISVSAFLFRDGAGVIFAVFTIAWWFLRERPAMVLPAVIAMAVFVTAVDRVAQMLFGDLFIYARNLAVYSSVSDQARLDVMEQYGVPLRVFANLTNLVLRPSVLDEDGGVAVIGVAYFISGFSLLCAAIVSLIALLKPQKSKLVRAVTILFTVSVLVVSLSPMIQPRYLLPSAVLMLGVCREGDVVVNRPLVIASAGFFVLLGLAIYLLTVGMPNPAMVEVWSPFSLF